MLDVALPMIYVEPANVIVHAAAVTSPPRVDEAPGIAVRANICGTANVVELARDMDARLVYVSTDYVFRGDQGNYAEEDELHPVNKYAWSKLGGECAVRMYDRGLIVRGSFGPVPFPYPKAFVDQWTTRLPVTEFARRLVEIVEHDPPLFGVVHVAGPRWSVYEYANGIPNNGSVGPMHRCDVPFAVPRDTSLILTRKDLP
jgi:dTDP-4-dehydrorhamnose reductase